MPIYIEREYVSKTILTKFLKPIRFSQKIYAGGAQRDVDVIVHPQGDGSDEIMVVTYGLSPKILRQKEINAALIRFDELFASCLIRYIPEVSQLIQ